MKSNLLTVKQASMWAIAVACTTLGIASFAMLAHADSAPSVTLSLRNGSNTLVTSAPIGTGVHAQVTVASTTATTTPPTGNVTFALFNGSLSCSGASSTQIIALSNGTAQSATTTVGIGGLSYTAHYSGDASNSAADSLCQPLTALQSQTSINTSLSTTSIPAGFSIPVHDSATLTGVTGNAGGSVAYSVFSNNVCTTGFQNAGTVNVTNGIVPDSNAIVFNTIGTFFWQAVYSGDVNNAAATSTCINGQLSVTATSSPAQGHIIVDKVTSPSGDPQSFHFNATGSGYGSFDLTDTATPNNQALNAGTYSITENSVSGWALTSALCSLNAATGTAYTPGADLVLGSGDTITCTFTNTKQATTTPGTGSISGKVFNDINGNGVIDTGETGLAGWNVTLSGFTKVYMPRWNHGNKSRGSWKNQRVISTVTTDGSGNFSFGSLPAGTYAVTEQVMNGYRATTQRKASVAVTLGSSQVVNFGDQVKPASQGHHENDGDDDNDDHHGGNGSNGSSSASSSTFDRAALLNALHTKLNDRWQKLIERFNNHNH